MAVSRIVRMALEGKAASIDGKDIEIQADSVCVHGDDPEALAFVHKISEELQAAGVAIRAF